MSLEGLSRKPDFSIEPDIDDPEFYCKSCGYKYRNRACYRTHLRLTHKIYNVPYLEPIPNYDIEPDPNDLNSYCKSYNYKHSNTRNFERHLTNIHKMNLSNLKSRKDCDVEEEPDPNDPCFYCKSCSVRYLTHGIYWDHLQDKHGVTLIQQQNSITNQVIKSEPIDYKL